ncbi:MAG: Mur ligase family protein [Patescibacteria group bacterium]
MKHIHFIGICGVGMSALAILWKKKGYKVTGSDAGFYPPVSTHLEQNQIDFYAGWHPEKMGTPDLVVVGNVASSENPEWQFVQTNNIPHVSYPQLIAQNLVKQNSIVCAGTYGKTSTTSLLAYILIHANYNPAYMFGGLCQSLPYAADDLTESLHAEASAKAWSVLEGDEYKTGKENPEAKFFSYKPTHLLLTGLEWDHFDMYPAEELYYDAFIKLLAMIPENGLIVACGDNENLKRVTQNVGDKKIVTYGTKNNVDYKYSDIITDKNGIQFTITHQGNEYKIYSPMLGRYMTENICGAFAMAREIGIDANIIIEAIKSFQGIKRRLEKRGQTVNGAPVFDDIAHSPVKAKSVLATLREIYTGKIIAVFEPNTGNRQITAAPSYDHAFADADEVIIPRLTKIKIGENPDEVMDDAKLFEVVVKTNPQTRKIDEDEKLTEYLKTAADHEDAIVFLGSHGFRGMIEAIISPHQ